MSPIDWAVLVGYLIFTTVLGAKLAGRQATIRDFFLGGRKLPWPAVAGSIIATEISAVTFIGAPAIVFAARGNFTYLQLAFGAILARVIIGIWFVPAFYEREIYSPYDYMGNRLGQRARSAATGLFVLGAILGQSVRVLITAVVLELISGIPIDYSIWVIGAIAVGWTLLGGITTVIWTDVIQFAVFVIGMIAALVFVVIELPGGWGEMIDVAAASDKFRFWNFDLDLTQAFTIWAALLANTIMCLSAYGTDQLIAQRMFCCKGPGPARKAIIASSVGQLLTLVALFVGVGLFAFYERFPLTGDAATLVAEQGDRIFPIFIIQQMPVGLVGLLIAGVFAAAISSLDSVLAALSQTVISGFYKPWREKRRHGGTEAPKHDDDRHYVYVSKCLVVVWGVLLCAVAQVAKLALDHYPDILSLALAMATYTFGAMLAAFALAFFKLNVNDRGIIWSAPISVLAVFGITWHQMWAQFATIIACLIILVSWLVLEWSARRATLAKSLTILLGVAVPVFLCCYHTHGIQALHYLSVAWPWNVPIGFVVAFVLGYALAQPRNSDANDLATDRTAIKARR